VKFSDLCRWTGTIERGPYLLLGSLLFAIKYNIDRIVVSNMTGERWFPWDYFFGGRVLEPLSSASGSALLPILIAIAIPFIWSGVVLTLRRLRSLAWPGWLLVFFFIPFVNLLLFALLASLPSRIAEPGPSDRGDNFLARFIPKSSLGSAVLAVVVTTLFTTAMAASATIFLKAYGWGLFLGLPFGLGFFSALIYNFHEERSLYGSLGVALTAIAIVGGFLFVLAVEGAICIAMAAPIAMGLALLGAGFGHEVAGVQIRKGKRLHAFFPIALALPFLLGAERAAAPDPDLFEVATVVEIDAPPERVWPFVIAFAELPPPKEALFRAGVAYPIRAEIFGEGPGAVRHCTFSTGAFVEPIEIWDPPRLLKFGVTAQPPAMKELSPWPGIQPAHVNDYLVTRAGQFLLEPLPGGRTRVTGTTWYAHRIWPAFYWRLWSDSIIHAIHGRVLEHIKRRAEAR
jgi:uncharacterized membrane protein YhaH (DUF805 family)